ACAARCRQCRRPMRACAIIAETFEALTAAIQFAAVTAAARPPPSFVPLVRRLQPVVNLPLGFVFGIAVALLQPSRQLLALALDDAEVIASELAPFLLNLAFELGP